jgi:hypothetical protein
LEVNLPLQRLSFQTAVNRPNSGGALIDNRITMRGL